MKIFEGKILRINLTTSEILFEDFEKYKKFIGGRGVNQYILFNELPIGITPFDPLNIIAIGAGILAGTNTPGASRLSVDSKNALTDGIGSSNCGGYFAAEMRLSEINNIIIKGKCSKLSYIYINDGNVEIIDANDLKGKLTSETKNILEERHGNVKVLCIGPAGENLVRSACIIVDGARSLSRCGLGAIMGSKNIKAIVVKGSGKIEIFNPEIFEKLVKRIEVKLVNNDFNKRRMKYGVYCYEKPFTREGYYRNISGKLTPDKNIKKLMADEFLKFKKDQRTCSSCPIGCWAIYEFKENDKIVHIEELEGQALLDFGCKLDIADPKSILKAHALCNDLGLDEDNVTGSISWAMECYEKGLLTKNDTNNLDLRWGNYEIVKKLLEDIAFRKGFGNILAEGCKRASKKIGRGTEKYCINVKGQELGECLWGDIPWALGTVVSPRGGTHTRGATISGRIQNLDTNTYKKYFGISSIGKPTDYKNKERLVYFFERLHSFLDCVGICFFISSWRLDLILPEDYAEIFYLVTGMQINKEELLLIGERTFNVEKAFNILHTNWGKKDDMPPKRFIDVLLNGKINIDPKKWRQLLSRYYSIHGWDTDGFPTKKSLDEIGLSNIAKKLGNKIRLS